MLLSKGNEVMHTKSKSNSFAEKLFELRNTQGLSRKTLSELCGLSKNMIARYEQGEQQPTLASLVALADYFEVSVDYLLCRK